MEVFRSKSCNNARNMQIEPYRDPPSRPHDFRSYSVSHAATPPPPPKLKKGRSSSGNSWSINDPEFQRKRRVASYKVYSVEGKVKGSVRKSLRWLKGRYSQVVYGRW